MTSLQPGSLGPSARARTLPRSRLRDVQVSTSERDWGGLGRLAHILQEPTECLLRFYSAKLDNDHEKTGSWELVLPS